MKIKNILKSIIASTVLISSISACGQQIANDFLVQSDKFTSFSNTGNVKTNIAFFIGMDDYNGKTIGEIKAIHSTLSQVGSTQNTNIFLSGDSDEKGDGFRTKVTKGQEWGSNFIKMGELDTGKTPALRDYIHWVGQQNPAQSTQLILGSHGGGYDGIMYDYDGNVNGPNDNLGLQQIFKALGKGYTGSRIESVNFEACMMATIEVGESLKGTVKSFAGSEDFSFGGSVPWNKTLSTVISEGKVGNGEEFLKEMVNDVINNGVYGPGEGSQTWSAIRLNQDFDVLIKKVDRLSDALIKRTRVAPDEIHSIVSKTSVFSTMQEYLSHYGDYYQRDLIEFCQLLTKFSKDPIVQKSAQDVIAGVRAVIIAQAHGPKEKMANGLAIYLPHQGNWNPGQIQYFKKYRKTDFANHTKWDEFILELNKSLPPVLP